MEAQPRQRHLTKFKEICCWKLLPARRQCEGFSRLLTGFGQTARVYMHTTLFFFSFSILIEIVPIEDSSSTVYMGCDLSRIWCVYMSGYI